MFLKAFCIGLGIAMPFGPISLLCIRQSLLHGLKGSSLVGLGASLAHGFYSFITFFGIRSLTQVLLGHMGALKLFGSLILLRMAYIEAQKTPSVEFSSEQHAPKPLSLELPLSIALLTLSNPMTIMSFVGLLAGIPPQTLSSHHALIMITGVCLGSFSWRLVLGLLTTTLKPYINLDVWLVHLQRLTIGLLTLYAGFTFWGAITLILQ